MHERNIFKHQVSFADLAKKYDFFQPFTRQTKKSDKCFINFEDDDAVRALSKALLLEYFKLNVEIPPQCLIPRIPLRLNYILWIEDMLAQHGDHFPKSSKIRGLDIGTGPCAIYALLAASTNDWDMYGSEINSESVECAENNVKANNLQERVKIYQVSSTSFFREIHEKVNQTFDFSMCNPPFFSDSKDDLMRPEQACVDWEIKSQIREEITCPGGEVSFVDRMVKESSENRHIAKIFTTMVGVKNHLTVITEKLKTYDMDNFAVSLFEQGKTCRWGLAWSWDKSIDLKTCSKRKRHKKTSQYEGRLSNINSFEAFVDQLVKVLNNLELEVDKQGKDTIYAKAYRNTWSCSRRKRRQQLRSANSQEAKSDDPSQSEKYNDDAPAQKIQRLYSSSDGTVDSENMIDDTQETHGDELKIKVETIPKLEDCEIAPEPCGSSSLPLCLSLKIVAVREGRDVILKMEYLTGTMGKDGVHQILQHLKNHPFI